FDILLFDTDAAGGAEGVVEKVPRKNAFSVLHQRSIRCVPTSELTNPFEVFFDFTKRE
ncbi:unnamed protein product, partial [Effrenium voratum]